MKNNNNDDDNNNKKMIFLNIIIFFVQKLQWKMYKTTGCLNPITNII